METLKKIGPIALIVLILLVSAFTFFKIPKNLKAAITHVDAATSKIDESIVLLKQQKTYLDSVIRINQDLQAELVKMKTENELLSDSIKMNFDNAHKYLYDILMRVKKLPTTIPTPG
jgi:predicted CopG family antitoxin